jgi:hypothetical protein
MLDQHADGGGVAPRPDGRDPGEVVLRRFLVDEEFIVRAGGVYWRAGGTVDVEGPPGR